MSVESIREPDGGDEPAASSEQPPDMSSREWASLRHAVTAREAQWREDHEKFEVRFAERAAKRKALDDLLSQRRAQAAHRDHRVRPLTWLVLLVSLTVLTFALEVYGAAAVFVVAAGFAGWETARKWTSGSCDICQEGK